jgi:hypothetical protein
VHRTGRGRKAEESLDEPRIRASCLTSASWQALPAHKAAPAPVPETSFRDDGHGQKGTNRASKQRQAFVIDAHPSVLAHTSQPSVVTAWNTTRKAHSTASKRAPLELVMVT